MFTGYAAAGEWLDIADGLAVMTRTTKDLGYEGLVLFLDELVLWLASHASDAAFVSSEASKVAKLVESGVGQRAVPMVSFVARQRELSDFIGDKAAGVQRAQVGQTIQYWEDRFDTDHPVGLEPAGRGPQASADTGEPGGRRPSWRRRWRR